MDSTIRVKENNSELFIVIIIIIIIIFLLFGWWLLSRKTTTTSTCTFIDHFESEWIDKYPTSAQCGETKVTCDATTITLDHPLDTTNSIYTSPRKSLYDSPIYYAKETVTEQGTCVAPTLSLIKPVNARYADFHEPILWDPIKDAPYDPQPFYNFNGMVVAQN